MTRKGLVGVAVCAMGVLAFSVAALALADRLRIPKARTHPEGAPQTAAVFSHWKHSAARCFVCHPGVFPQEPVGFLHADMNAGRFCGRCHNGREAKPVSAFACEACHAR